MGYNVLSHNKEYKKIYYLEIKVIIIIDIVQSGHMPRSVYFL